MNRRQLFPALSMILAFLLLCSCTTGRHAEPEWLAEATEEGKAVKQGYRPDIMKAVMDACLENVQNGYGAVAAAVVKDGEIIVLRTNEMKQNHNSYDHAEMVAIREAEKALGTMYLKDCELYTSAQPCVMCEAATYWARISKVYYAASVKETSRFEGFDDLVEYTTLYEGRNLVDSIHVPVEDNTKAIELWVEKRKAKN